MAPEMINKKDYSISLIRFIALLFIFLCHIFQRYNNVLNGWFDCGVQMFFFISGFLYSTKTFDNIFSFYKKQFIKILSDYYIFIICIFLLYFILQHTFDINQLYKALALYPNVKGTEHLWFIRYILTCYLMLPIFVFILNKIKKTDNRFYIPIIALFAIIIEYIFSFILQIKGAWLVCFMLGMVYKRLEVNKGNKNKITFLFLMILFAIIFTALRILCYYNYLNLKDFYNYIWQYCHIFLGISVALIIRYIYLNCFVFKNYKILDCLNFSDKYSYDFYIVHYGFIQNIFLLPLLSEHNMFITSLLCFILSWLFAIMLQYCSKNIKAVGSRIVLSLKGGNIC